MNPELLMTQCDACGADIGEVCRVHCVARPDGMKYDV